MNIDLLLDIVSAWTADPSFVGMTSFVGTTKASGLTKASFCHADEGSI